jgi:transcriptional antiterminator NusG
MYDESKEPAANEAGSGIPEPVAEQDEVDRPAEAAAAPSAAEADDATEQVSVDAAEAVERAPFVTEADEGAEASGAEASEVGEVTEEEKAEGARASKKSKPAAGKKAAKRVPEKKALKGKKAAPVKKRTDAAAVAEAPTEEPENKLPMKWYAVHTYSGHENKVKENIQKMVKTSGVREQFGRLIVPTEEVAEMRKGKKTITTRKFFPSYILIEMFMSEDSWHLVNAIPGVTSFVGTGTTPQPLAEAEVERILGRMDKERETIVPEIPFTLGEHIRIKDGPFSDFTGVIDEINTEKGKLRVLVSIFGRETPVELDFLQVEPI